MDAAQQPDVSSASTGEKIPSKKPLLIGLIVFIVILYTLAWLQFLGVYKITDIFKTSSPLQTLQKQVSPYQKEIDQLNQILISLDSLSSPLNPRISQEEFESRKGSLVSEIEAIKEDFARGDVESARSKILRTRQQAGGGVEYSGLLINMLRLGDIRQEKFVPQEIKQEHDPKDKYIQKLSVDPRIYEMWLPVVDVLVGTDN